MNAKAALCKALLAGEVINIKNCVHLVGYTNAPREIGRSIEREESGGFGVIVSRTKRTGKSRYGGYVRWFDYRLNLTPYNRPGIKKMKAYVRKQMKLRN